MSVNEEALMWVEKYRPKNLNEVVDLHDIVESLKAFMRNPKTMPHLMFAGIPGTGKTSPLSLMPPTKEALTQCVKELRTSRAIVGQVLEKSRLH